LVSLAFSVFCAVCLWQIIPEIHLHLSIGGWISGIIGLIFTIFGIVCVSFFNAIPNQDIGKSFRFVYSLMFVMWFIAAFVCWTYFFVALSCA
jgi:hypothetical protein